MPRDHDGAGCGVEVNFSEKIAISCILSGDHSILYCGYRQSETVQ